MAGHSADLERIKRWHNPRVWSEPNVRISVLDAPAGDSAN